MKYFAEFDTAGNKTAGYAADGMPYTEADIRTLFPNAVEISEEDFALYNQGYIRGADGKPVPKPVYVPTVQDNLLTLDAEYQPLFKELQLAWAAANLDGNNTLAAALQTDYAALKAEYNTKREAIISGN